MDLPVRLPNAIYAEHILLDTDEYSDAILTGRDGPESPDDGLGLRVVFDGTGTIPAIRITGPDGAIELTGEAEISCVANALGRGAKLAADFGDPIPYLTWVKMRRGIP